MGGVYKSIEMVGTSQESFDDAVRLAVRRAAETVRNLEWFEVQEQRGYVRESEIREYQVKLQIWFKLEEGAGS